MKLKAQFQIPKFDMAGYKSALQERLGDAIAHAAFDWLQATVKLIPVWSGASASTFRPLASQISFQLASSPLQSVPDRQDLGLENSTGNVIADANSGKFEFSYSTTLKHLIINEFHDARQWGFHLHTPGPYHFQEAGQRAFKESIKDVRLPSPFDHITRSRLKV